MTLGELKQDLSTRLGKKVIRIFTRDGEACQELSDLYIPSPAGFGGILEVQDKIRYTWELWLEAEQTWNFQVKQIEH